MNMSTPAPWVVDFNRDGCIVRPVNNLRKGHRIASGMTYANARLAAAAPAGLALAKHIVAMADDAYLGGHPEFDAILDEARALIAAVEAA